MKWSRALGGGLAVLAVLGMLAGMVVLFTSHQGPGTPHPTPRVPAAVSDAQILFGDLHVHTTFSTDAFTLSLPLFGGEGAHPPADACDYARYCAQLDFFALTDHAEALTPRHWRETKAAIRQCNAIAGDTQSPDLVAFTGWEWTQNGTTPANHYGHKNVIFPGIEDDELPTRPIAAKGLLQSSSAGEGAGASLLMVPLQDPDGLQQYLDAGRYYWEIGQPGACPSEGDVRSLPEDCREFAATPATLFEKLDQWGFDALVIPHGTTWGFYTPPGADWTKQIGEAPDQQRLIEIFSGHGNSESYRSWRAVAADGSCPAPTADYEPCCWRAGEIIRDRCGDLSPEVCEQRVIQARADFLALGSAGHLAVPGTDAADWKACGSCQDCYGASFRYRPGGSVQYIMARGNFDDPSRDRHASMGFIASSDNHSARPGTGYKERDRWQLTEARGPVDPALAEAVYGPSDPPVAQSRGVEILEDVAAFYTVHTERQASFFLTGGLVAVHSEGRSREAIWSALQRKAVYGTSGERILLWFDLVSEPEPHPMGSTVPVSTVPRFEVRAAGSFEQKPGCAPPGPGGLPASELARLCLDECYHPSDTRHPIIRIEVVRIRPQIAPDEPIAALIEDPWLTIPCDDAEICTATFTDPELLESGRSALYYVRALQAPSPTVNLDSVRCQDESCAQLAPCYADWRVPQEDDCLAEGEERAWSSPILLQPR